MGLVARYPHLCRINKLHYDHFTSAGWGVLHGPEVKAANSRHLSGWLVELAAEFFDSTAPSPTAVEHACICKLTKSLDDTYKIMYSSGMFFTADEHSRFTIAVQRSGKYLNALRYIAKGKQELYWNITPKCHYFLRLPRQGLVMNPRFTQCYHEESLIGKVAIMWGAATNGPYRAVVQRNVMIRCLVLLATRLNRYIYIYIYSIAVWGLTY